MKRLVLFSLISAAVLSISGRPWGSGLFALVALIPLLYVLIQEERVWRGALATSIISFTMMVVAYAGVFPFAPWIAPLLILSQMLWYTIPGAAFVFVKRVLGKGAALASLPVFWLCAETIPAQRWLWDGYANTISAIGFSQFDTPLLLAARWSGMSGISFLVLVINIALFLLLRERRWTPLALALGLAAAAIWTPLPGATLVEETEPLSVVAVQGSVSDADYLMADYDDEARERILETYGALTEEAAGLEPDLTVWAETTIPGWIFDDEDLSRAAEALASADTALVGGKFYRNGHDYNAAFLWQDAQLRDVHSKRALVPIAESFFTKGKRSSPIEVEGTALGIGICFESIMSDIVRASVLDGAETLVFITSDAFAGKTDTPYLHMRVSAFMAAATGRYVLHASQSGPSAVISDSGHLLSRTKLHEVVLLQGELHSRTILTPFVRYGNWLGTSAFFLSVILAAFAASRKGVRPLRSAERRQGAFVIER